MINPIEALHYVNPKVLDELVGFEVDIYYTKNNKFTCFWEKDGFGMVGKSKDLSTEKITKKCLDKIQEIQNERKGNKDTSKGNTKDNEVKVYINDEEFIKVKRLNQIISFSNGMNCDFRMYFEIEYVDKSTMKIYYDTDKMTDKIFRKLQGKE